MTKTNLLLGQTLHFSGNPMTTSWEDTVRIDSAGGVLVAAGKIIAVGPASALRSAHPEATVHDYGDALLCPGFVDAHVHYPQTAIIASWGKRLIDWLNSYTFPEEMRLADPHYAARIAGRYLDLTLDHGTTTVCSFATVAPHSVDAIFTAAAQRGQRVVAGKTCMDRNAPEGLRDTAQSAYDDSKTLIERWHGKGRAGYAITPRFTPTSTPDQLAALGALWAEHPDCLMQTHLSEQLDEIAWVRDLVPGARDYLDTYEEHGLIGERALFGHAIHLEPRELDRLAETGAAVVHCPTSNTFIGSGLFDMAKLASRQIPVGLATDTGGGSSFSMLRTMAAAYEIGQLRGTPLHAAQLIWLATAGSARSLHLHDKIGSLTPGLEADITVLDLASTPAIEQRSANANSVWDRLFATIMMGDDRAVQSVWVNGRKRP
ncbi:guanine deaminase [Sulfitobacter sp.]|jgi:guanine deaminase|uniref:guanine deaminase n=1 Tax=Sulfitobacter sp. TaxID=1903071 RepID=UPI000C111FA4|nr:guanine deaminase [Roseobacter sp.]MBV48354.1 guanine deaminase [Roseobacter sp.]PHR09028.1 MAG: guanine deaminase [Sulfitobacter sp.]|tara:strand:+ start:1866 stop:3158 length:1293 start_codon:yes stop_codon:yes gene_type:complete